VEWVQRNKTLVNSYFHSKWLTGHERRMAIKELFLMFSSTLHPFLHSSLTGQLGFFICLCHLFLGWTSCFTAFSLYFVQLKLDRFLSILSTCFFCWNRVQIWHQRFSLTCDGIERTASCQRKWKFCSNSNSNSDPFWSSNWKNKSSLQSTRY